MLAATPSVGFAATYSLVNLVSFKGINGGVGPNELTIDANGHLFGTTQNGGTNNYGMVFGIAGDTHSFSVLASFTSYTNTGANPYGKLLLDSEGNLFGTTSRGGTNGVGTVFEVSSGSHSVTNLASFSGISNGANPNAGLIADSNGNMYGTTYLGGSYNDGTVFQISMPSHAITPIVTFSGPNGQWSHAGLVADSSGNLYGTTSGGGSNGAGTVFEILAGTNQMITLYSFDHGAHGWNPQSELIIDAAGNLYGTNINGGGSEQVGTVFKISADTHALTTLATFDRTNGAYPYGRLVLDGQGNLFGTTYQGGTSNAGTVFEIAAGTNVVTTIHSFSGTDGRYPRVGLVADAQGNLYGTTELGGKFEQGTVFELIRTIPEPSSILLLATAVIAVAGVKALKPNVRCD